MYNVSPTSAYAQSQGTTKTYNAELVERGLPIVRRLAFRLARRLPPNVEVDDLISAGNEGLLRAATLYEPTGDARFEVYAERRIRGAMLDELRAMDPVTRHGRQKMRDVSRAITALTQENGQPPTEEMVAERLGMDVPSYRKLSADLSRAPALGHVSDASPEDVAGVTPMPDARILDDEKRRLVANAITHLPERTQQVMALYYQEECTQAEIGRILGVTEGRVCQILGEAAARIRSHLGIAKAKPKRSRSEMRAERNPRT